MGDLGQLHLSALRKLVEPLFRTDVSPGSLPNIGFTREIDSLGPLLGTRFIGCPSKSDLPAFFSLVSSLRRLGCLLLLRESERLAESQFPGSMWATIFCERTRAERLNAVVSRAEGFGLAEIHPGIYVLLGRQGSSILLLSSNIDDLALMIRGEFAEA